MCRVPPAHGELVEPCFWLVSNRVALTWSVHLRKATQIAHRSSLKSAAAKRSAFLFSMLILIVVATLWAWAGTAQGASLDVTKTADTDDGCLRRRLLPAGGDTVLRGR